MTIVRGTTAIYGDVRQQAASCCPLLFCVVDGTSFVQIDVYPESLTPWWVG